MPIKINPVEHAKKFTAKFNFMLREENMQRRRLLSQSSVGSNSSHQKGTLENPKIDGKGPSHHSPRIQQPQVNSPANRSDSGISCKNTVTSSSSTSFEPKSQNILHQNSSANNTISKLIPPPPQYHMSPQSAPNLNLNMPPPSFSVPLKNNTPRVASNSNQMQPASSYREHRQRKWEENQSKKRRTSQWSSSDQNTVPLKKTCNNASIENRKGSVDTLLPPRPPQDTSSLSSVSSLFDSTLNTREKSSPKEIFPLKNTSLIDQQPKEVQKSTLTRPTTLPSNESVSKSLEKENICQEIPTQANDNPKNPQNLVPSSSNKETSNEPLKTEEKLDIPIKLEIKEEIDSDVETIPENFHDDDSVYSGSSDIEGISLNDTPYEEFIPLNIKNEPIDPVPSDLENVSIDNETIKIKEEPLIKCERNDSDDNEIDESILEGESDAGSEMSVESTKTDLLGNIDYVDNNKKFKADVGLPKTKLNSYNNVSGKISIFININ